MSELDVQKELTQFFIAGHPATLILTPYARVMQTSGQWKQQAGQPREPQVMRVVEESPATSTASRIVLEDGTERRIDYMVVAAWNAEIANGDRFVYNGDVVEVVQIDRTNGYETRAAVVRRLSP